MCKFSFDFRYPKWCLNEEILIDLLQMYFDAVVVMFNFIQIGSDHTVHHLGLSLLVAAQLQLTPFPWCIAIRENNVRGQPPKKCPLCTSLGILETGIYAWAFLYTVLQLTWKNKSKDESLFRKIYLPQVNILGINLWEVLVFNFSTNDKPK